ncbi:DUF6473 family protein [Sulfitobacter sp. D35]|uniref:DUF6473 family protein n=1 Tax=Sulfitobacter sp. D35 TaxID=3083252 RepID=UPI00296FCA24|nr:DUF6473 family protein [Sulfitobacter sp. D35]MDW4500538.1 DUF6473 family protein [Sulfitobacter sp. D35]
MSFDARGKGSLNYGPCQYDRTRLMFRGPRRRLDAPYIAFLGGTETYGKYIRTPFPALVETALGVNCVNFGIPNAGIDAFANDIFVLDAAHGAEVTVLQVLGAHNLSNRFYTVHPRRNDRFVAASKALRGIFKDVDFAEFNFNKHMLRDLHALAPDRFEVVRDEIQTAWVSRMRTFLDRIPGRTLLLWIGREAPGDNPDLEVEPLDTACEPLMVTRAMLDAVAQEADGVVEVVASEAALAAGTEGMVFNPMDAAVAAEMLGPKVHGEVAAQLETVLEPLVT